MGREDEGREGQWSGKPREGEESGVEQRGWEREKGRERRRAGGGEIEDRAEESREVKGGEWGWVRLGRALPILAKLDRIGPGSTRLGFVELGQLDWNWLSSAGIGLR